MSSLGEAFQHHVERIKAATLQRFSAETTPEWICKHTTINDEPYSFKDHEYQDKIARDQSREIVIRKCSQVGISELSVRIALALCAMYKSYTVAYTLPTAGFAATFMRTRVDPVIQSSPYLSSLVHVSTDNSEVKRLNNSYLYLKGSQSGNAPISVPCDHLVHDEVDFSNAEVISQYQSRISHSRWKRKTKLSTPTIPGRGIDKEWQRARRHWNLVKCNHCGLYFQPDYFLHVKVPGWDKSLQEITKNNLHLTRWAEAALMCPKCGKEPSLQPEHREWVCENNDDNHVAAGFQVQPFDAPNIISVPFLVESSTQYKRYIDFVNFGLGLPAEDKESTLLEQELKDLIVKDVTPGYCSYVMGLDMGILCHCVIAAVTHDGFFIIVHTEVIPVHNVRVRRKELAMQWRVRMTVVDHQPYTETVLAMQTEDDNLYAAIYVRSKNIETHNVREQEEDVDLGKQMIHQVNINRDKAFDAYMEAIRSKSVVKKSDANDDQWVTQHMDMKRVKEWTADAEMTFVWRKSEEGADHFHHGSLYAWIASNMLGVSRGGLELPVSLMTTFAVQEGVFNTDSFGRPVWGQRG